jgi:hypothetical protein
MQERNDAPSKFELTEKQGPWMVFAGAFAGPGADQESARLVAEFRERWRLPAYTYREHFDFSGKVCGNGLEIDGTPMEMQHRLPIAFDEIAVLVGSFPSVNDPKLQETLKFVKYCRPRCLESSISQNASTLRFAGWRFFHQRLTKNPEKKSKGPLGKAFVARNPLLPRQFFAPTGLDPLVASINEDVKYSLLTCPGKYSVRIATFRGNVVIDPREVQRIQQTGQWESKLAVAADKAHRLVETLRNRGVEAYEFHDRSESVVTVGSFNSLGLPQSDGTIELHPAIHRIAQTYGATHQPLPGRSAGVMPKTVGGIILDVQPTVIEVPRRSVARDYERSNSLFR